MQLARTNDVVLLPVQLASAFIQLTVVARSETRGEFGGDAAAALGSQCT